MKKFARFAALAAVVSMAVAPAAMAASVDSSWDAMSKSGNHQFYVWCTGKADSTATEQGSNAKDAQAKLAAKVGNTCWPVWQGLAG